MWDDLIYAVTNPKKSFKNFVGSSVVPTALSLVDPYIKSTIEEERAAKSRASSLPLEVRAYWSSIINPELRQKPLTESELYEQDKQSLYDYVNYIESRKKEALKKNPKAPTNYSPEQKAFTVGYEGPYGYKENVRPGSESIKNTLGAFNYTIEPDGTVVITDKYDFKPMRALVSGQEAYGEAMVNKLLDAFKSGDWKGSIRDVLAIHGSTVSPSYDPKKARQIQIRLSPPKKK